MREGQKALLILIFKQIAIHDPAKTPNSIHTFYAFVENFSHVQEFSTEKTAISLNASEP